MYKRKKWDNSIIYDINTNEVELIRELTGENYYTKIKRGEQTMLRQLKDGEVYVLNHNEIFDTVSIRTRFYKNGISTITIPNEVFSALSLLFKHTYYGYVDTDDIALGNYIANDIGITYEAYKQIRSLTSNQREREIKKVIFNEPATIVFWGDGTKTVVKCSKDDEFDPEKGLAMAIAKKFFGNENGYSKNIKKWTDAYEKTNISINTGAKGVGNSATDAINNVVESAYKNLETTLMQLISEAIKNKFGEDEE